MEMKIDPRQLLSQATSDVKQLQQKKRNAQGLHDAMQQFEAIFIQQMFKDMRNTIPQGGVLERGNAEDTYTQMLDAEVAKRMAERGGIGLAELMLQQLPPDVER